jgi:hypothetical protein
MNNRLVTFSLAISTLFSAPGCNSWPQNTTPTSNQMTYFPYSTIIAPITTIQPKLGMSYSEFSAFTRRSGYGDPIRVTTKNNLMIYSLPYQPDIYFWFEHNRLSRVTRLQADDPSSWETNEISPDASIVHTQLNPLPVGF